MKILYLCNQIARRNGWSVINYYTVLSAVRSGHEVHVLTDSQLENETIPGARYLPALFGVDQRRKRISEFFAGVRLLRKLLKQEKYDVVHVLVEPYLLYFAFARHPKLVLSLVGTYAVSIFRHGFRRHFYRFALRRVSKFVAISHYTADRFRKEIAPAAEIEVLPLGVDFELFERPPAAAKERSFCLLGQLKERKGVLFAIQAIERLKERYPDVRLYVLGESHGSYSDECREYVRAHRLSDNVRFEGHVTFERLAGFYSRSLANILPSVNTASGQFEGFGLIHLEANASGIPSIGSYDCGNESAIVHGQTGRLCRQRNIDDLVEAMAFYIEAYETRNYDRISEDCIRYAKSQDWKFYGPKLLQTY